jgi:hypothetical protein
MSLREAYEYVRTRRPIFPLKDNQMELLAFERSLRGFNSMNIEEFGAYLG